MSLIKKRPGALVAIGSLIALGCIAFALRTVWVERGGTRLHDKVWQLTLEFHFQARQSGAAAFMALPVDTPRAKLLGQNFFYPRLRQARLRPKAGELHEVAFVSPQRGRFYLRADFQFYSDPSAARQKTPAKETLSAASRELYLSDDPLIQIGNERVKSTFEKLFASETDKRKLLDVIADFCEKKIAVAATATPRSVADVLLQRKATALERARTMIALCRIAKIPARLISGFILAEKPDAQPHFWIEAYMDNNWLPYDPENGYRHELPFNFVAVRRGGSEILRIEEGSRISQAYAITHIVNPHGFRGSAEQSFIEVFDLTRLPLSTQSSLIMLLLLPIGTFVTTFTRNILGIRAIGTFTPTLLALAAVYADWRTTITIFIIVVTIGFGGRALMPGLKLLKIPRLSVIFTLVTVSMTLTVSILEYFHFTPAGHVVLLPLVVLTTIVDRTYTAVDRDGKRIALKRLGCTIGVAIGCVWLFRWEFIGRLLLVHPELHFITLALLLLLGLYNARKLSDFSFFQFLAEDHKKKDTAALDNSSET
jgi:hypothetical protein